MPHGLVPFLNGVMDPTPPRSSSTAAPLLDFTVIVPTYGRPGRLAECLGALAAQDYPAGRFEVVVVDDGSPMSMLRVIEPLQTRLRLTLVQQANAGPARARNHGAEQARGQFLAFTDDDCTPEPGWLGALGRALRQAPDAIVGGPIHNRLRQNRYSEASQTLVTALYRYYNRDPQRCQFFTSNNIALARDDFARIGGFDTSYSLAAAEDREFCDRWTQHGGRMIFVPEAIVTHAHAMSLWSFVRQHYHYGQGAYQFRLARARRHAGPVQLEPGSFYASLLTAPWSTGALRPWSVAALQVVAQAANAAGYYRRKLLGPHDTPASVTQPRLAEHQPHAWVQATLATSAGSTSSDTKRAARTPTNR